MPGVICPACGDTWAAVGEDYPAIDLAVLPNEREYRKPRAVAVAELDRLRRLLIPLLPHGVVPSPGAEFGSLIGKGRGQFGDFAWVHSWIPLIRREALSRLQAAESEDLIGVVPELTYQAKKYPPELLELHIAPHASLAPAAFSAVAPPCSVCDRVRSRIERLVIARSSLPHDRYIFRLREVPRQILATDRFKEVVQQLGLTDVVFEEVEVTD